MDYRVSASIDVSDMTLAMDFYTGALPCVLKKKYADHWQVVTMAGSKQGLDIHLQQKAAGSVAAANQCRDYARHWTPVHLDFTVPDIRPVCAAIERSGGHVEHQSFSEQADIAHCADPFGNGFCVIRE